MMEGKVVELSAGIHCEGSTFWYHSVSQFLHIFVTSQIHGGKGFLFSFDKIISPSARQAV